MTIIELILLNVREFLMFIAGVEREMINHQRIRDVTSTVMKMTKTTICDIAECATAGLRSARGFGYLRTINIGAARSRERNERIRGRYDGTASAQLLIARPIAEH